MPFEEFRAYTDPYETRYDMAQISPRVFEAAALRTPMVLYTGRYSGLIEPGEHYIELKKDFSNVDAVLDRVRRYGGLERLAERAYRPPGRLGRIQLRPVYSTDRRDDRAQEPRSWDGAAPGRAKSGRAAGANGDASHLRELPTRVPNDPVVFLYKFYSAEIARLNRIISDLHGRLTAPAARTCRDRQAEAAVARTGRLGAAQARAAAAALAPAHLRRAVARLSGRSRTRRPRRNCCGQSSRRRSGSGKRRSWQALRLLAICSSERGVDDDPATGAEHAITLVALCRRGRRPAAAQR